MQAMCEFSHFFSRSLLVQSFEVEIQPSRGRVDTARG